MKKTNWKRRDLLKTLGLATIGATFSGKSMGHSNENRMLPAVRTRDTLKLSRPVKVIVLGAGNRGWGAYSSYGLQHPEELQVVGVAEPIPYRRERISKAFNIPAENQFVTWEHVFDKPKFADALFITTPDDLHYGPAMAGLEMGYDLLLEKVIAQTWEECNDILQLTIKKDAIVAVCHVLRYAPYFKKMKDIVASGEIGDVVSIEHTEKVEHTHMSHSFVRGEWRNSKQSNPIILSKSCHDTDLLRWIVDKPCTRVSSFGSLSHFKEEKAPEGSTARCTDGCLVEAECPYSAIRQYEVMRRRLAALKLEEVNEQTIRHALETGPYGRCVYRCDNDVMDHQISNFEFEDNITASFSMEGLTFYGGRITRICGTKGDIFGDNVTLRVSNFSTRDVYTWNSRDEALTESGHYGGDHGLVHDFVRAVYLQKPELLSSTIQASMASQLMGFRAEDSRIKGTVEPVNL